MTPLPATNLRNNVLTLAVPNDRLPGVAVDMCQIMPVEDYDPAFQGQYLQTTYFDTPDFALRKTRLSKDQYLTLRIRRYAPTERPGRNYPEGIYALSVKTEAGKYRTEIHTWRAELFLRCGIYGSDDLSQLPADLLARYLNLVDEQPLVPVVTVCFTRYAVESTTDRITLDTNITTSTGRVFPSNVLEVKTTTRPYQPPVVVTTWGLSPLKLSKFLWATSYGDRS
jgi:hypothetical protein